MTTDSLATLGPDGDNIRYRDAIASPRSRNGSRVLSLMSLLRVNSGTAGLWFGTRSTGDR